MSPKDRTAVDREIGRLLSYHRQRSGLSQTALGRPAGITFQQVQKYEKGTNRISVARLMQFAGILGVEPTALIPGAGPPLEEEMPTREGIELAALVARIPDAAHRRKVVQAVELMLPGGQP